MNRHVSTLDAFLRLKARPRILVVGDCILDRYLYGQVERVSPEAPVQVLSVDHEEARLGGAAFTAGFLSSMGCEVAILGIVGDDTAGQELRRLLFRHCVDMAHLEVSCQYRTCCKERMIGLTASRQPQHLLRLDRDPRDEPHEDEVADMLAASEKLKDKFDAVAFSDYRKHGCPGQVREYWLRDDDIPSVVDGKPWTGPHYDGADLLKLNRAEAERQVGYRLNDPTLWCRAVEEIRTAASVRSAIVTLGPEGMVMADGRQVEHLWPVKRRQVYDATGAGDVVTAVLGMGLASGLQLVEAAQLAQVAAGWQVEQFGATLMTREQLKAQLIGPGQPKLASVQEAEHAITNLRRAGAQNVITFTNGCFDLLGTHHLAVLREAAQQGHWLVVGLNSDASVRRLKGEGRPVRPERYRAELLAALEYVDQVVVFDEPDPTALIARLQPDVLVKGADAGPADQIPGAQVVLARGGRVHLVPTVPGHSTTNLLKQIRQ